VRPYGRAFSPKRRGSIEREILPKACTSAMTAKNHVGVVMRLPEFKRGRAQGVTDPIAGITGLMRWADARMSLSKLEATTGDIV
jgi:hypothetical protein